MPHKNFAFIRVAPIPQWGIGKRRKGGKPGKNTGLAGHVAHDLRFMVTNNADPERMKDNIILCDRTGWKRVSASKGNLAKLGISDPYFLTELAKEKLKEMGIKAQKNHVKCAAFINSVSPEFLRDGSESGELNPDKVKAWMRATVKFNRQKHGDNLLMICFHMDELNPHASVYALPVREKSIKKGGRPCKGEEDKPREYFKAYRLDYWEIYTRDALKYEIDGETKEKKLARIADGTCSKLQDEYTRALQEEGLDVQRGIRRDPNAPARKHQEMRKHYDNKRLATEEVSSMTEDDLRDFVTEKIEDIKQVDRLIAERDHYQISGGVAQQQVANLEKKITDSQRELPVADVIAKLTGLDPIEPDDGPMPLGLGSPPKKRKDIHTEFLLPNGIRLGVNDENGFENLTPEIPFAGKNAKRTRGKGALDAVMFLTEWEFKVASEWLADIYSPEEAAKVIAKQQEEILKQNRDEDERIQRKNHAETIARELETPDESQWESVKITLLRTYKFREAVIEKQHDLDWIDANKHGHLILKKGRWDEDGDIVTTGKIILDLKNPTVTLKETGDNGIYLDTDRNDTSVIICSSAIDAMAIKSTPEHYAATLIVIGKKPNDKTVTALKKVVRRTKIDCRLAESLTAAGQRLAAWMREHFPEIETLPLPKGFQNWLDYHRRPRLKSDPVDLRVVNFPGGKSDDDEENEEAMTGP